MNKDKRVLVVEDDEAVWTAIKMCLDQEPYRIEREKDGAKALERIRAENFDAILLDWMLSGLSGGEILQELDRDPKFNGFPILVNSVIGEMRPTRDQAKACRNLRVDFTPRPFDPTGLANDLRKMLGLPARAVAEAPMGKKGPKKKVLIVDDESAVRAMYVPYFTAKGYDALAASNGQQAVEILKKEKIALIILDLNMPVMSGEDVMRAMVADPAWKEIPIIVDTAVAPGSGRINKIKTDFADKLRFEFFLRPTSLVELNEAIDRILIY